jgi:membrane protein implicated in regulation of membrane protease activity
MSPWIIWLIVAAVLGVLEMTTGTLFFLCMALAAVVASLTSLIPVLGGVPSQVLVFVAASVFFTVYMKRFADWVSGEPPVKANVDGLIGERALVTQDIDPLHGTGMVKVMGEVWRADATEPIRAGEYVWIEAVQGTKLIVYAEGDMKWLMEGETESVSEELESYSEGVIRDT